MKTDTVFKRAFNDALDIVSRLGEGEALPSENTLSARLGVSRTTVRKIIANLAAQKAVTGAGRQRTVRSPQNSLRRFPAAETISASAQVEKRFMEWMLRDNARPGTTINELELARQFGVATTGIREFLNRFQAFGLIEKRRLRVGCSRGSRPALRLSCSRSGKCSNCDRPTPLRDCRRPQSSAADRSVHDEHVSLLQEIDRRYHDFSDLDNRFHHLVNSAVPNRFIDSFTIS